ncbi:MAG: hypothetical protein AAGF02_01080 [Actinomycetota bacterium]
MTSPTHGADVADGDQGGVARDSQAAMWTWRDRLSDADIDRIRRGTDDVSGRFYGDEDWDGPPGG